MRSHSMRLTGLRFEAKRICYFSEKTNAAADSGEGES
jgi:hypothetical protein